MVQYCSKKCFDLICFKKTILENEFGRETLLVIIYISRILHFILNLTVVNYKYPN